MASDQPKPTYIGVTYRHRRRQYQSAILIFGKMHNLGFYKKESTAAQRYDEEAKKAYPNPLLNLINGKSPNVHRYKGLGGADLKILMYGGEDGTQHKKNASSSTAASSSSTYGHSFMNIDSGPEDLVSPDEEGGGGSSSDEKDEEEEMGTSETPTDKATTTTKSNPLAPPKHGPGRPRKYPRPEEGEGQKTRMKKQASTAQSDPPAPAKRGRGRPRKYPRPEEEGKKTEEEEGQKKKMKKAANITLPKQKMTNSSSSSSTTTNKHHEEEAEKDIMGYIGEYITSKWMKEKDGDEMGSDVFATALDSIWQNNPTAKKFLEQGAASISMENDKEKEKLYNAFIMMSKKGSFTTAA